MVLWTCVILLCHSENNIGGKWFCHILKVAVVQRNLIFPEAKYKTFWKLAKYMAKKKFTLPSAKAPVLCLCWCEGNLVLCVSGHLEYQTIDLTLYMFLLKQKISRGCKTTYTFLWQVSVFMFVSWKYKMHLENS